MTKQAFIFLIAICMMGTTLGQQCDPNGISTNPADPSPALGTGQPSFWTNQFDWRAENFSISSHNYTYPPPSGYIWPQVRSPFWNSRNEDLDYLLHSHNSDFAPEDGWELIQHAFGFVMGGDPNNPDSLQGTVNSSLVLIGPYIVLYNRYRGVLRVFGTIGNPWIVGYDAVEVTLGFGRNQRNLSAMLSYHTDIAVPLDQKTQVAEVTGLAPFPSNNKLFCHADFPMAYDPCTCHFGSALQVGYRLIKDMNVIVSLDGQIPDIPTSVGTILNSRSTIRDLDFLIALHRDGYSVEAGVTTYKRTQDLVNRYRAIADARQQAKQAAAQAGKFPKFFKGAFNWLDFGLGIDSLPPFTQVFDPSGKEGFVKDDGSWTEAGKAYSNGLKAAGYLNKFASKQVKTPSDSSDFLPELGSVIEGEMRFGGTVDYDSYGAGINMQNPGSFNSQAALEREYPTYNEILGLFAVLETPDLHFTELLEPDGLGFSLATHFKFAGDLKYVFNPSLPIDFNKTKILASIEVSSLECLPSEFNTLTNPGTMSANKNVFEISAPGVHTTPWVDLECLEGLDAKINQAEGFMSFYLKLLIFIQYETDGSDGQPNRHVLQVTYPLNTIEDPSKINHKPEGVLFDVSYDQATSFGSTQTIYAWNDVYINGDLTIDPNASSGTEVRIIAANSIEVSPNVSIDPRIKLETGLPFTCSAPIPQTVMSNTYCQQKYRARFLETEKTKRCLTRDDSLQLPLEEVKISVFPNPSDGEFTINYGLAKESEVEMVVHDNTGRQIKVLAESAYQEVGRHSITTSLRNLSDGVYHLVVRIDGVPHTHKLIKK